MRTEYSPEQYARDCAQTLVNREKLAKHTNLLYWYEQLYRHQLGDLATLKDKVILEIGSGSSPLQRFVPTIITSDVMDLPHLDHVFDCHEINQVDALPDNGIDIITLTNVLHHVKEPVRFLLNAATKLKAGGQIIATEPYFSLLSTFIYKYIHHEPVDLHPRKPELRSLAGPLASANIALPHLLFLGEEGWSDSLRTVYDFSPEKIRYFSALSYMITGGISHKLPIPSAIYPLWFRFDMILSSLSPRLFASFFTIILTRKGYKPSHQ